MQILFRLAFQALWGIINCFKSPSIRVKLYWLGKSLQNKLGKLMVL